MKERNGLWTFCIATGVALVTIACSTTTFQSTWRSPDARPLRLAGRKVAAVFISKNATFRRRAEDALAREISARGAQGMPAYTVLSDDEVKDQAVAREKFEKLGFSGAVVMRVVGSETQYTYEPGIVWSRPHYHHFWGGYWGWGWGTVWEPAYLTVDKIVKVETLVYSLEQDQLVWAGVSRTVDPQQVDSFIAELAAAVSDQMAKDGLLTKS
jgi:hypothetical protein